jgi:hypothetical protein
VVERAQESEPVHVFGRGQGGVTAVEIVDPAGESLVGGEAAVGCLPEVAMCGDEARDHEVAVRVDDFVGVEGGGRFSCGDGQDGSVWCDGEIAVDGLALIGGHGHDARVANDEFGVGGECGRDEDCEEDECPTKEEWKLTRHGCV